MQTHLKGFGLENFRVFKDYTWFDFAPITILTGPNSSGKSSLNKALHLVQTSLGNKSIINFEVTESLLQLGGFDRILNVNSEKNYFSFAYPYELNNFPTLGEKCTCETVVSCFKDKYNHIYASVKLNINNETLLQIKEDKIYFDFNIFFKYIKNTAFEIKDSIFKRKSLSILFERNEYYDSIKYEDADIKGKYAITNPNKPWTFDSLYKVQWKEKIEDEWRNDQIPFKEIIYSDSFEELKSLVLLYQKEIKPTHHFGEAELFYEVRGSHTDPWGETTEYINEIELANNPLIDALKKVGLSSYISEFINNEVINFDKFIRLDVLSDTIIYLPLLESKPKRAYSIDSPDNDNIKSLIASFFKLPLHDKEKGFIEKWQGPIGFNIGKIQPKKDDRLGILTIEVDSALLVEKGFGITQILTLILNVVKNSKQKIYILEEPEANLHPNFQSKLADFFVDAAQTFGIQFIIETHSEYLIRKLQFLTLKKEAEPEDSVIYYFKDPNDTTNEPLVKKINIQKDGRLTGPFGKGFLDETGRLMASLLTGEYLN